MGDLTTIRQRLAWPADPATHRRIKRLWVRHSLAEDARDLDRLIATLTPDCVYRLVPTGHAWSGHDGARAFYTGLLTAFPDVHFDLTDIVIGPQGVIEVATVTGTHVAAWAGFPPSGGPARFRVIIHFPWDPTVGLFAGENVYFDRAELG